MRDNADMKVEQWEIGRLIPYARNPRKNDHAVERQASLLKEFGFRAPIIVRSDGEVVDGHLRLKAARKLGLDTVPVVLADDLTPAQIKALRISMNKSAELAQWDEELLRLEFDELEGLGFDLDLTGFDVAEIAGLGDGEDVSAAIGGAESEAPDDGWYVLVIAKSDADQRRLLEELSGQGYECRSLTS